MNRDARASDQRILAKRQRAFPRLWELTEAFLKRYRGAVHLNWGAPFSVRTKVKEGRLEIDVSEGGVLLRFEKLQLPEQVSFTTNRKLFRWPYSRRIGDPGAHLAWALRGGAEAREDAVGRFLAEPSNAEDLRALELGRKDWISIDPDSIFVRLANGSWARVSAVVEPLRRLARRQGVGRTARRESRLPRVTGRLPTPAALRRWPNWRDCLDEESEESQDETTLRPDLEQAVIGKSTTHSAVDVTYADGRHLSGLVVGAGPDELWRGTVERLLILERGVGREVLLSRSRWTPSRFADATVDVGDRRRLPLRVRSVLPVPSGRHLELVLQADGRISSPVRCASERAAETHLSPAQTTARMRRSK